MNKSFCQRRWTEPFFDFSSGKMRYCCRTTPQTISDGDLKSHKANAFANNDFIQSRRQEMLEGVRHADCKDCWSLEDKGIRSPRLETPFTVPEGLNKVIKPNVITDKFVLHLLIDDLCDLKCVYCSNSLSSSWRQEDLKFGYPVEQKTLPSQLFEDNFWLWFEEYIGDIKYIVIMGGEPTISKRFYQFLDRFKKIYSENKNLERPEIIISTNLNANENYFQKLTENIRTLCGELQFRINISVSMESFGERAEYIRNGLVWSRFQKNLEKLRLLNDPKLRITLNCALNAMCASSLTEYLNYFKNLFGSKIEHNVFNENIVLTPSYLSPLILTPDFAKYFYETSEMLLNLNDTFYLWKKYGTFLRGIAHQIQQNHWQITPDRAQFANFIRLNDHKRNSNFLAVFPEYSEFLDLCASSKPMPNPLHPEELR